VGLVNALFTSTSAVCVTGLTVTDTFHWNLFGQVVILTLIQLGGFGFMTGATIFLLVIGRPIGLRERVLIGETAGIAKSGALIDLIKGIAVYAFALELVGTIYFVWIFSMRQGGEIVFWPSLFHAVSSFNNAGLDVFGASNSLAHYGGDLAVLAPTALLVVLGGLGYLVLADAWRTRSWHRLTLDSKMIISVTAFLLIAGAAGIILARSNLTGPSSFTPAEAMFLSVSSRTAGFSTFNLSVLPAWALFWIMLLMFVGGAPGSTAGGIKVSTAGALVATVWSTIKGRPDVAFFERELSFQQVRQAITVIALSLFFLSLVVLVLTATERVSFLDILFESVSAFSNVGLSTGVTAQLSTIGKLLVVIIMFVGRLGPLSLALALSGHSHPREYRYPGADVRMG
jgi:trk system potassium uptake protein TrkH